LTLELVNAAGDVVAAAEPLTLTVGVPAVAIRAPALDQTVLDATLSCRAAGRCVAAASRASPWKWSSTACRHGEHCG
jgi:hypothetical protein